MIDESKILVTGGRGLVGSCVKGYHKPSSEDLDLMDFKAVDNYIALNRIEYVIHCAALVGGVKENTERLGEFFYKNMQMNLNVLEACRINKVKKVVSLLTTCIFPAENIKYPLTHDQLHNGAPHESNYGYAHAKRMLEVNARAYRDQYGMNIVNIVPCNVYGPRDNFNLQSSHLVPGLIHKAFIAKQNNEPLKVWGDGSPKREFIYSEDLGKIIDWSLQHYELPEPLIVSSDNEISIKEVAERIRDIFDLPGIEYETDMPKGQYRKPSDNTLLKSLLDFPYTSFNEGLKDTVEWFNNNYETLRK